MFEDSSDTDRERCSRHPCTRELPVAWRVYHKHQSRGSLPGVRNVGYCFVLTDDRGTAVATGEYTSSLLPFGETDHKHRTIEYYIIAYKWDEFIIQGGNFIIREANEKYKFVF